MRAKRDLQLLACTGSSHFITVFFHIILFVPAAEKSLLVRYDSPESSSEGATEFQALSEVPEDEQICSLCTLRNPKDAELCSVCSTAF